MTEKNLIKLGEFVRELRTGNGIKSADLAKSLGVSQSYISDLENGKKKRPRVEVLERIAQYFGDPTDDGVTKFIYMKLLGFAGYVEEINSLEDQHTKDDSYDSKESKEVVTLAEFLKKFSEYENQPLKENEFILYYKDRSENMSSIRYTTKRDTDIFDLNTVIQTEFSQVRSDNNGFKTYGPVPLYYCGKELTNEDRIKIMKILDALFDIDRKKFDTLE